MSLIAQQTSICSGHDGYPPRPPVAGVPFFLVNGIPVLVNGIPYDRHTDGDSMHDGVAISTRPWFLIDRIPVVCAGDPVSCGSVVAAGDPLVLIF